MEFTKLNFRCPTELVAKVDEEADSEHRDRTSMLIKIIDEYYKNKSIKKKKAGAR
jgi:hypothetical protein